MLTLDDVAQHIKTDTHLGGEQVTLAADINDKDLSDRISQVHNWLEADKEILSVRIFSKRRELGYIERSEFISLSLSTVAADSNVYGGAGNLFLPGKKPNLGAHYVCPICGADLFVLPEDEDSIEIPPKCKNMFKHSEPVSMNLK